MENNDKQIPNVNFFGTVNVEGGLFNIHDNEHVQLCINDMSLPKMTKDEAEEQMADKAVPDSLSTPEARALWQLAMEAGWVDSHWQPTLSGPDAALLAFYMGKKLGINGWKPFEKFWGRPYLRQDYNKSRFNKKSDDFEDELKRKLK